MHSEIWIILLRESKRMVSRCICGASIVLVLLQMAIVPCTVAIDTMHGGLFGLDDLIIGNFTIWYSAGQLSPFDLEYIDRVASAGAKVIHMTGFWCNNITNPLDIIYNTTIRHWAEEAVDFGLNLGPVPSYEDPNAPPPERYMNTSSIWAVGVGDEEPAWLRFSDIYSKVSDDIAKYDNIYFADTGFHLKPLYEANNSERWTEVEWLNNKSVWVYNYFYDYIKSKIPHALVTQFILMPPTWGIVDDLCAAYEVNADINLLDCYYAKDYPWLLYETIRRYKTSLSERPLFMTIWGTIWDFLNTAGDGLYYHEGSYEQIRRETWTSYVSGVDALGFFDWAPENNNSYTWSWGQGRTDVMGRKLFKYVDNLAGQLNYLPTLNSSPEVLVVGDGYQTGEPICHVSNLRLFTEYDLINQRCFAKTDVDLSKYSLILLTDYWHYNATVTKINDYIANGGNVVFLGGVGNEPGPEESRLAYLIEHNSTEYVRSGHILLNITTPNLLDLNLVYDAPYYYSRYLRSDNFSADYHLLGLEYIVDDNGTRTRINDTSIVLYHNASMPDSGWILYCGTLDATTDPGKVANYDHEKEPDLWLLYRTLIRAFAKFLNITNSISTNATENVLITQGLVEDDTLLAAICNFNNESRVFNYTIDLSQYGLPDGTYFVHSLDANRSLGTFTSHNKIFSFNVSVVTNGTRILLISQNQIQPGYTINIFPKIPDISATTTTNSEQPSTTTNVSIPSTTSTTYFGMAVAGVLLATGLTIMVIVIFARKKQAYEE
ncbi:MAG: hypothetical protein K9W43_06340 [Candidatus Thorarchaeota archaeon]|nr:hypothetical protein [Candidatus Thorarchaeota archaeon]